MALNHVHLQNLISNPDLKKKKIFKRLFSTYFCLDFTVYGYNILVIIILVIIILLYMFFSFFFSSLLHFSRSLIRNQKCSTLHTLYHPSNPDPQPAMGVCQALPGTNCQESINSISSKLCNIPDHFIILHVPVISNNTGENNCNFQ